MLKIKPEIDVLLLTPSQIRLNSGLKTLGTIHTPQTHTNTCTHTRSWGSAPGPRHTVQDGTYGDVGVLTISGSKSTLSTCTWTRRATDTLV